MMPPVPYRPARRVAALALALASALCLPPAFGAPGTVETGAKLCLLHAAQANRGAEAQRCLAAGADVLAVDATGRPALAWAVLHGNSRLACALLTRKADLRWQAADGGTLLHEAVRWPVLEPSNAFSSPRTRPSLAGKHQIVDRLLRAGLDPNARDATGSTPLHVAVSLPLQGPQPQAIVERLLLAGAQRDLTNAHGLTALDLARRRGATALIAVLERTR